jgi:hypothetical protein
VRLSCPQNVFVAIKARRVEEIQATRSKFVYAVIIPKPLRTFGDMHWNDDPLAQAIGRPIDPAAALINRRPLCLRALLDALTMRPAEL